MISNITIEEYENCTHLCINRDDGSVLVTRINRDENYNILLAYALIEVGQKLIKEEIAKNE